MRRLALSLALATLAWPLPAAAQTPREKPPRTGAAAEPAPASADEDTEEAGPGATDTTKKAPPAEADDMQDTELEPDLIPPALDTLSGHLSFGVSTGHATPFGSLSERAAAADLAGAGPAFGVHLGFGIARSVVLGLYGQLATFSGGSACADCSSRSVSVGPLLRYHIVQGVRFDPYMAVGLGFRTLSVSGAPGGEQSYSGFDWLHLELGGDWYAFDKLAFGPFLNLDYGVFGNRPSNAGASAGHWLFQLGARVTFDTPGK